MVESLKKNKQAFIEDDRKALQTQISDLQMTLEINKSIICDLLQCKNGLSSGAEKNILKKINEEGQLLRDRNALI